MRPRSLNLVTKSRFNTCYCGTRVSKSTPGWTPEGECPGVQRLRWWGGDIACADGDYASYRIATAVDRGRLFFLVFGPIRA
jgi:hypothetical protein